MAPDTVPPMEADRNEFSDVQFSASSLWARRSWVVLGLILGALLALAFVFTQPETNRSWAQVLIRPLGVDLTRGAVDINRAIDTVAERELAGSFIVAERTSDALGGDPDPRTLRREVSIQAIDNSQVLEFSYADEDAEVARDIAQNFAESYLAIRSELAAETVADSRRALEARQGELIAERDALIAERAGLDEDADDDLVANLRAENLVSNQLSEVSNDISLLTALTSDPGDVISPAQLAQQSERPRTVPTVLAGAVLGALLALLAALFFDRSLRDRDLNDDDLEELGLAPIGHLPRDSRGADAFAGLGRRVSDLMGDDQVLAITTTDEGTAASQIGTWFAWNKAESGARVLLVSADFDNRMIANQFGLAEGPGLLDALVSGADPDDIVQRVGNMHVITAGQHAGDPVGVLQMVGMTRFLNRARRVYDTVVIHAPNVIGREASLLATWAADGVTVVVDDNERHELQRVTEMLQRTDARLLGSVVLTTITS